MRLARILHHIVSEKGALLSPFCMALKIEEYSGLQFYHVGKPASFDLYP